MILEARQISLRRLNQDVLSFPDLAVRKGDRLVLSGPSGAGKTTLLSILAGLLPPTTGTVLFDGEDFYRFPSHRRDRLRGRNFGFIFQTLHLLPSLSVRNNLRLAGRWMGKAQLDERLETLSERLGLSGKLDRQPHQLSQGEQQRIAIARAVLGRPRLIVADEPTSSLDDANTDITMNLILEQARETGAALLVATHDHRILKHFDRTVDLLNFQRQGETA